MVPPLDNFISRDTETFVTGPYLDMIVGMFKKVHIVCFVFSSFSEWYHYVLN